MTDDEKKAMVIRVMDDARQEAETERKLDRLAAMPDLLERYDAATKRIAHLSILIDWIGNEIKTGKRAGETYPSRLTQAVEFLRDEVEAAMAEIEGAHDE